MARICFVAGDPSGDLHAAHLIDALRRRDPSLSVTALGGAAMQQAGAQLLQDLTASAAIGPFDAAQHLGSFIRARRRLDAHLAADRPDAVILVDFGDFNLPFIAPLVKRRGIPVLYYISPQLWAWGGWRLRYVQRYVDRMLVLFPFEERLYREAGVPVTWVGHPLVESARPSISPAEAMQRFGLNPWRRTVGLLPGSRERELSRHLPLMLGAARTLAWHMPGLQFLIPKAPSVSREAIEAHVRRGLPSAVIAEGRMADLLQVMDVAAVASGTATLEAALGRVPMAVVYRASWPTYAMAKLVLRTPHIGLVNVVAGRRVVPELIQRQARPSTLAHELLALLRNDEARAGMRQRLGELAKELGEPGAVDRAAEAVRELLATTAAGRS